MTHGLEVPNSMGIFGGYPGSCVRQRLLRSSNLEALQRSGRAPADIGELEGELEELGPKPGLIELKAGDVFQTFWQGGGGFGDPLDRDPALVAADHRAGHCSAGFAERLFGVVLAAGTVDEKATAALREEMRRERLAKARAPRARHAHRTQTAEQTIAGRLCFGSCRGEPWFACRCGTLLAPRNGNWRDGAAARVIAPEEAGFFLRLHPQLELRQFFCPGCGGSLAVDTAERGAADIRDMELN
jgi:N-methylhydantoinase B